MELFKLGAALDRVKREAIVGKLDRSFDMFGVHVGLKYKDPADRLKGGELRVAIDDMKAIFPRAHSKRIDINLKFDGGASKTDGLFNLNLNYLLEHGDGDGDETGSLTLFRKKEGDNWVSQLKTVTTGSHTGRPILPSQITNAQIDVVSDRKTKFNLKYVNPSKGRDMEIDIDRIPGKQAKVKITNGASTLVDLTFGATDLDLRRPDGNFKVSVDGMVGGDKISGSVEGKKSSQGYRVKIDLSKGNRKALQVDSKVKADPAEKSYSTKTIYSAMGGVIQGTVMLKYADKVLTFSHTDKNTKDKVELMVKLIPGKTLEVEGKKNGEVMWSYKSLRTTVDTPNKFEMTLNTDMTLNSKSILWTMMDKYYPYGAFNVRRNEVRVFVDKKERNLLLPKFLIDVKLYKEGVQVVTLDIDTTVKPYKFLFIAPNIFKRWNVKYDKIEGTMDHDIGKSINIKTNIGGGIEIQGNRGNNNKGGRDINILTKKAGKQMMKINISTEKNVDDNEIRLVLRDSVEIDPDSLLYRKIVKNYRLLTPFTKRTGEFEIYVNKRQANVLLPKFSIKGEVKKDATTVMKAQLTTESKPYQLSLYLPTVLNKIYSDMDEYKVTVTHNPGQLLQIDTNGKKFKGFKISRTGSGNEREIVINGKKLGSGDYTLTDNSFSTKVTIADGNWIQPKVTWEGKLPSNKAEAETFFLKNNVHVEATGSKRSFNGNLQWKMDKPDFDFNTPWNCKMTLNLEGEGPNWGTYSISRNVKGAVANKIIELAVTGDASFTKGVFAKISPVNTDVNLKYVMADRDLIGKFSKIMNGKEYSVDFPVGSGVIPKIVWGQ